MHFPFIEISLDNCVRNFHRIRERVPDGCPMIPVVKDAAYGCGARRIARELEKEGAGLFAVARMHEARDLRETGITAPVLVLGECTEEEIRWASAHTVHCTLNDTASIAAWRSLGCPVHYHINVDTGMGRLGIMESEAVEAADRLAATPTLVCEGVFTHYASADVPGTDTVQRQLERFSRVLDTFRAKGLKPRYVHSPNSAAVFRFPLPTSHLVRPGIALYGCRPDPAQDFGIPLEPVVRLVSRVLKVKRVPAGTPVSYGGTYTTPADTHIVTIDLGYAHGYPRTLGNRGSLLIRGRRYPIAGRVTMDYLMIDAGPQTDIEPGDEVVAAGAQGEECITIDEIARQCGTIGYEILCGLSARIDRHYYRNGTMVGREEGTRY